MVSSERILSTISEQQILDTLKKIYQWLRQNEKNHLSARFYSVLGMHSIYFNVLLKNVPLREQIRKLKIEEIQI